MNTSISIKTPGNAPRIIEGKTLVDCVEQAIRQLGQDDMRLGNAAGFSLTSVTLSTADNGQRTLNVESRGLQTVPQVRRGEQPAASTKTFAIRHAPDLDALPAYEWVIEGSSMTAHPVTEEAPASTEQPHAG